MGYIPAPMSPAAKRALLARMLEGEMFKDPPVPTRVYQGPALDRITIPPPDPQGIDNRRQPKPPRDPLIPALLVSVLGLVALAISYVTRDPLIVKTVIGFLWLFGVAVAVRSLRKPTAQPDPDPEPDTMYPLYQLDDMYNEIPVSVDPPEPASDMTPLPGFATEVIKTQSRINQIIAEGNTVAQRRDGRPHSGLPQPQPGVLLEKMQAQPTGVIPGRPGEAMHVPGVLEVLTGPFVTIGSWAVHLLRWLVAPTYPPRQPERITKWPDVSHLNIRSAVGPPPRPTPPVDADYINVRMYCPNCDDVKQCRHYIGYAMIACWECRRWLPGRYPVGPDPKPLQQVEK